MGMMGKRPRQLVILSSSDEDDCTKNVLSSKIAVCDSKTRAYGEQKKLKDGKGYSCPGIQLQKTNLSRTEDWSAFLPETFSEASPLQQQSAMPKCRNQRSRSSQIAETDLWVDKYKPRTPTELAVNKKKVAEMKAWIEGKLNGSVQHTGSHVLLLKGPTGVGKTTTIHLLIDLLGIELYEWDAPTPTLWREYIHHINSGTSYISKLDEFEAFLDAIRKYPVLNMGSSNATDRSRKGMLLLVDDLPTPNGWEACQKLCQGLRTLALSAQFPTIVSITEFTEAGDQGVPGRMIQELELALENGGATKIVFNPLTSKSITKTLTKIWTAEYHSLPPEWLSYISESSEGDLRHAINSLQFYCLSQTSDTWNLQKSKKHSRVKVDPSPLFSEILLRIDTMALVGDITKTQASEIRKLVVNKDPVLAETFCNLKHMNDKELAAGLLLLLDPKQRQGLHILHICTEMAPITKVGSVASHVKNLCCALQRRKNFVEVILPKYKSMDLNQIQGLQEVEADFSSYFGGEWHRNRIWTGIIYGIAVTFIEPFHPSGFFDRDLIYGYEDDFERFTYFCRASLDYLLKSGKQPDILHLHNWQTAAVAPLFWDIFVNQGLGSTRILFTCHNFEFQCVEEPRKLRLCGLDPERLHRPDRLQDNLDPGLINLIKGGIVYSNSVVMISTPFVKAKMTKENSHGLESTLTMHKNKVISVPYGLDDTVWDPAKDKFLPATYSAEDLSGKAVCKVALRRCVGLSETQASTAIVGCVNIDMSDAELNYIKLYLTSALRNGAQFVFMGTSQNPRMQAGLEELQKKFKENVRVVDKQDEGMLHLLIAGSDILLCSSFHDPENQMPLKALKYGAVPLGRSGESMSFMLHSTKFSDEALSWTQVFNQMKDDPLGWTNLVKGGMVKDFSWDAECAERYTDAYWSIHQL